MKSWRHQTFFIGKEGVTENERFIYLRTRIIAGEVMIITKTSVPLQRGAIHPKPCG